MATSVDAAKQWWRRARVAYWAAADARRAAQEHLATLVAREAAMKANYLRAAECLDRAEVRLASGVRVAASVVRSAAEAFGCDESEVF
jgi:hypothetical protein